MSSTTRTTGTYAGGITQATIDDVLTRIGVGKVIRVADVQTIYDGIINAVGHTHSYYDISYEHNYGNKDSGTSASNYTTGGASPGSSFPWSNTVGGLVRAADINQFVNLCVGTNGWRNHSHSYTDYYVTVT
jgi:hypothetical protein